MPVAVSHHESSWRSTPIFSTASIDESWPDGRRRELRVGWGSARHDDHTIMATDDLPSTEQNELLSQCESEAVLWHELLRLFDRQLIARIHVSVRQVEGRPPSMTSVATLARPGREDVSVVTTRDDAADDWNRLTFDDRLGSAVSEDIRRLPFMWRGGSAAVLLHEVIGHASEERAPALRWPKWLRVRDIPFSAFDDCGEATVAVDLLSEGPHTWRRESFRDVPLRRMSGLTALAEGSPAIQLPDEYVEIDLVSDGSFDSLTDVARVRVAVAWVVRRDSRRLLEPFVLRCSRRAVAGALVGMGGDPVRYPGVLCSSEGQTLYVASSAADLLTSPLAIG